VLADEGRLSVSSQYSNSDDYVALPTAQKVNILGVPKRFPNYDQEMAVLYSGGEICYKQPKHIPNSNR
jgi:hypothetical protein